MQNRGNFYCCSLHVVENPIVRKEFLSLASSYGELSLVLVVVDTSSKYQYERMRAFAFTSDRVRSLMMRTSNVVGGNYSTTVRRRVMVKSIDV